MPSHPILVVDDDRDTADTITQLLAAHGYPARPAYSCTDALITARDCQPGLVLLDLHLGDGNGHDLAGSLTRTLGYRPVFAAVTGLEAMEAKSRYAGFDHHLVKPVPPEVLLDLVKAYTPRTN